MSSYSINNRFWLVDTRGDSMIKLYEQDWESGFAGQAWWANYSENEYNDYFGKEYSDNVAKKKSTERPGDKNKNKLVYCVLFDEFQTLTSIHFGQRKRHVYLPISVTL